MNGSITHRGQDREGRDIWRVRVYLGDGQCASRTIHGARKDAERARNELLAQQERGDYVPASALTVVQWCAEWLVIRRSSVSPGTLASYESHLAHLVRALGKRKLAEVAPKDIQLWQGKLLLSHAASTVSTRMSIVRMLFEEAVNLSMLQRNPCKVVRMPATSPSAMACWTAGEAQAFLAALEGHHLRAFFAVAIYTGLRACEVIGLRWEDYDAEAGVLRVRRTWGEREHRLREGVGKTKGSIRSIDVGVALRAILAAERKRQVEWRLRLGPRYEDPGVLCPSVWGGLLTSSGARHHAMVAVAAKAGVPAIRFHDLRHTHASIMLASRVPVKVVSERLGHSSALITMRTYAHVLPGMQREAVEQFDVLVGPPAVPPAPPRELQSH